MRKSCLIAVLVFALGAPALAVEPGAARLGISTQEEGPSRGDDLERNKAWRAFLTRADRAFFAARMSTEAVRAKIAQADERVAELEAAAKGSEPDPGGRADITADVAFLERAARAFTAAGMNTADVQKWLQEAKEK